MFTAVVISRGAWQRGPYNSSDWLMVELLGKHIGTRVLVLSV